MVRIDGGDYPIGAPGACVDHAAMPAHRVTLRPFRIDRTEVTNAAFAEFLNALPVKPTGTARAGAVGAANLGAEARWLFQEATVPGGMRSSSLTTTMP